MRGYPQYIYSDHDANGVKVTLWNIANYEYEIDFGDDRKSMKLHVPFEDAMHVFDDLIKGEVK
jgi:hypothetical protein